MNILACYQRAGFSLKVPFTNRKSLQPGGTILLLIWLQILSLSPSFHLQRGNPTCCFRMTILLLRLSTPPFTVFFPSHVVRAICTHHGPGPSRTSLNTIPLRLPSKPLRRQPECPVCRQGHKRRKVTLTDFSPSPGLVPAPPLLLAHCVNYVIFLYCRLLISHDGKE